MMDFISAPLTDSQLYHYHYLITYFMIAVWIIFAIAGYFIKNKKNRIKITYFLIFFSIAQEIFDYVNRIFINDLYILKFSKDLPLQLCHISYWFTVICMVMALSSKNFKYKNYFFSCAYIFGFGALQGIITVDLTGLYTFGDMLALHLQHSLIVLNLIWLIFCFGMKLDIKGIIHAFISINVLAVLIGLINYFLESNYMFLCYPPDVDNVLIAGEWPYYIIVIDLIFILIGWLSYLPFKMIALIKKN